MSTILNNDLLKFFGKICFDSVSPPPPPPPPSMQHVVPITPIDAKTLPIETNSNRKLSNLNKCIILLKKHWFGNVATSVITGGAILICNSLENCIQK
jgi:hypothetical protein